MRPLLQEASKNTSPGRRRKGRQTAAVRKPLLRLPDLYSQSPHESLLEYTEKTPTAAATSAGSNLECVAGAQDSPLTQVSSRWLGDLWALSPSHT